MKLSLFILVVCSIFTSCQGEKENQTLVTRHREQGDEIERLEDERRKIRNQIERIEIPDDLPDLEPLKAKIKEATAKKEELEKEIQMLEEKKKNAAADFEKYQKDYPIR